MLGSFGDFKNFIRSDYMKGFLKNNFLFLYIIINILFVFVISILDTYRIINMKFIGNLYLCMSMISLLICVVLLIYKRIVLKNYSFKLIDLLLLLLIIVGCISSIYAIRTDIAWTGLPERGEGIYTLIYYYCLLFLSRFVRRDKIKSIINIILIIGVFEVLYASLQKNGSPLVHRVRVGKMMWAFGTFLNPNFFSSFIVICFGYTLGLYTDANDKYYKVLYGILNMIFCYGLLLSNAMSGVIGICAILLILFIYSIYKKKIRSMLIMDVLLIFLTLFFIFNPIHF